VEEEGSKERGRDKRGGGKGGREERERDKGRD
jgi:hypothetical protein